MNRIETIIFLIGCLDPQDCRQQMLDAYNDTDQIVVMSEAEVTDIKDLTIDLNSDKK